MADLFHPLRQLFPFFRFFPNDTVVHLIRLLLFQECLHSCAVKSETRLSEQSPVCDIGVIVCK